MDRRTFLSGTGAVLVAAPVAAKVQQAGKVYRIGLLGTTPLGDPGAVRVWGAFFQGLRELGYVEGQNLVIERRFSEGRDEQLPDLAADLVHLSVDVIVAAGGPTPHAAKLATTTIPIVAPNHGDPVGTGLIASLARPGGNVTGLSIVNPELTGKRLELLKEAIPRIVRVAVLWNPTSRIHPREWSEAEAAARVLQLQPRRLPARGLHDYEAAFSAMTQARADALLVLGEATFWLHRMRIAELAATHRLPAMFAQREHVEAGGLICYGVDLRGNYRRAATYVDKILKGAKPADLPVEQPTTFELVINMKTAKALGLTIPQSILLRADEVIQ